MGNCKEGLLAELLEEGSCVEEVGYQVGAELLHAIPHVLEIAIAN